MHDRPPPPSLRELRVLGDSALGPPSAAPALLLPTCTSERDSPTVPTTPRPGWYVSLCELARAHTLFTQLTTLGGGGSGAMSAGFAWGRAGAPHAHIPPVPPSAPPHTSTLSPSTHIFTQGPVVPRPLEKSIYADAFSSVSSGPRVTAPAPGTLTPRGCGSNRPNTPCHSPTPYCLGWGTLPRGVCRCGLYECEVLRVCLCALRLTRAGQ